MTVIVAYLPTPEGEAAFAAGLAESRRRDEPLLVVNSPRTGAPISNTVADEDTLARLRHQAADHDVALEVRLPSHTDGSTTVSSPSTTSVPRQVPSWANRCASRVTRDSARITCRCSRSASLVASQVRSIARPSVSSSTTRSLRSGSSTSTR